MAGGLFAFPPFFWGGVMIDLADAWYLSFFFFGLLSAWAVIAGARL